MKKFIYTLLILLTISSTAANPMPKSIDQGLYSIKDTGLVTGLTYNVRNASSIGRAIVIVFDQNQMMQEFVRLEPNSPEHTIKPLDYGYTLVVVGGSVTFS